ncbi:MAG: Ppx/GppA phosphatase family protein [candidate division BRC1 bacterium ADurb.BinA364]|nr:MAG: Ppx/GppA phosphatase family protein [candidate division BRC1 bacterium ADurb.BinA364]
MRRTIDRALEGVLPLAPGSVCFGSGGGFSTLGQMAAGAGDGRNLAISLARIEALAGQLSGMSAMQCARRFGIPPRRARIMPAGAWTAVAALRRLGSDSVTISWAGLREALALEALGRPLRSFTLPRRTLADRT